MPETTTTQAVPSLLSARTCVTVHAWPYVQTKKKKKKQKKNFQTTCQKQQPHRPFLRSRVPVCVWPYMRGRMCVAVRKKTKKNLSNNYTDRSFALVNDDWIGALCLSRNAHKKSKNY